MMYSSADHISIMLSDQRATGLRGVRQMFSMIARMAGPAGMDSTGPGHRQAGDLLRLLPASAMSNHPLP